MGTSEHYCLRWNNHQNNLLGVFSQLLRDESLVDVTLACSEGHSIRAHRVVLSACSSYFQTLFVDHPSRHPIVILKDVRFAELRTLIEFMYRGEVNVEYCQLPALLKTAESLKVKGLAEMTNVNSGANTTSSSSSQPLSDHDQQQQRSADQRDLLVRDTNRDRDVHMNEREQSRGERERERERDRLIERDRIVDRDRDRIERDRGEREPTELSSSGHHRLTAASIADDGNSGGGAAGSPSSRRQCDSVSPPPTIRRSLLLQMPPQEAQVSNDTGGSSIADTSPPQSPEDSVVNLTCPSNAADAPSDLSVPQNNNNSTSGPSTASCSRISTSPHHHDTEPIAGPSGLPPVQQVPLSLKKEVDWGGGAGDEKNVADTEYSRHPYDQFYLEDDAPSSRSSTPFPFVWGMFGSSPLDDASSRLLSLLNTRLAAAAAATAATTSSGSNPNPDLLEHQNFRCVICLASFPSGWLLKRHAILQHSLLPSSLNSNEEKPFVCEQCGQSYRYRSAYLKHREQNHRARLPADKLFTCDVCGMQFRYLKSFKKHRLNHALERLHGKTLTPEIELTTGEGPISLLGDKLSTSDKGDSENNEVTSTINESGSNEDNEDGPVNLSDKDNLFKNVEVKKEAPEEDPTTTDVETTTPATNKRSECDQDNTIDSLSFPGSSGVMPMDAFQLAQEASILNLLQADAVERHQRERRFACPFCGKCVRSKENLKLHVRKHTGERPFVCLFCGRAFGGKSDLTRHLRIHTGERPYHCEACGKCFARADYLSKHLTTHMHSPR